MSHSVHLLALSVCFLALASGAAAAAIRSQRRIRPYYATIKALSGQFPGRLSKLSRFFMNQPCFLGTFSGCKFSATYTTDRALYVWHLQIVCHVSSSSKLKIFMYERNPGTVLFAKKSR